MGLLEDLKKVLTTLRKDGKAIDLKKSLGLFMLKLKENLQRL